MATGCARAGDHVTRFASKQALKLRFNRKPAAVLEHRCRTERPTDSRLPRHRDATSADLLESFPPSVSGYELLRRSPLHSGQEPVRPQTQIHLDRQNTGKTATFVLRCKNTRAYLRLCFPRASYQTYSWFKLFQTLFGTNAQVEVVLRWTTSQSMNLTTCATSLLRSTSY